MDELTLGAKVISLEAAVKALIKAHPAKNKAFFEFSNLWTAEVGSLNQAFADNAPLAKAVDVECNYTSSHFFKM